MADEEEQQQEEGNKIETPVVQESITKLQWLAMLGLSFAIVYLYIIWPNFFANKKVDLKEPYVYIEAARDLFKAAHGERAFPRDDRVNTLLEVTWNYEAAIRAGADLELADRYRWAYASYHAQSVLNPDSRYALVSSMENFILALKQIEASVPDAVTASGEQYQEIQRKLSELPVMPEKVKFLLASAYLKVKRTEKAIPLLQDLQKIEHEYQLFQRRRDRSGLALDAQGPVELDTSPYRLQKSELEMVNLLLGQAYDRSDLPNEAIQALNAYLESTREMELAEFDVDSGANMGARYEALKTLAAIHFHEYRKLRNDIKKLYANRASLPELELKLKEQDHHLQGAHRRLSQLFIPLYSVYGLEEQQLMYLEVAYQLGLYDSVLEVAEEFDSSDPHRRNEMKLWKIMAQLKKSPTAPVTPMLVEISLDNTKPYIKLASQIILGDNQVENGKIDMALGSLIPENQTMSNKSSVGAYYRAAFAYAEEDFDKNVFIGKLNLINSTMQRANQAKEEGDEDLAIKLYRFLLEHFTVPKATILHEIATLKRIKGHKVVEESGLNDEAKELYNASAEHYLMTENFSEVPYDQKAREESYFQAAESYFEGGFYTKAYENYGKFIDQRPDDLRVSKARHKKGVSALYRKYSKTRFQDARKEFLDNISIGLRSVKTNGDLPEKLMMGSTSDIVNLDKVLHSPAFYERITKLGEVKAGADLKQLLMGGDTMGIQVLDQLLSSEHFGIKVASLGNLQMNRDDLRKMIMGSAQELLSLDEFIQNSEQGSRDIWAYQSLLELGNTYNAEHRYDVAGKVFGRIKNDRRFSPRSEIWRKAAYADAKMTYSRVSEMKEPKPWEEAIGQLEDILTLYDLSDFGRRFSPDDKELYEIFRRSNAELKYMLAKAYLNNRDSENAKQQCLDLLSQKEYYDISLMSGQNESTQMVTEQKVEALLADAYYELKDYVNSMEHYRRAHDRNLGSWERPFYSLSIVDCLIGMKKYEDAKNHLKRTRWEFEKEKVYTDDKVIFSGDAQKFDRSDWLALVEQRMELIP